MGPARCASCHKSAYVPVAFEAHVETTPRPPAQDMGPTLSFLPRGLTAGCCACTGPTPDWQANRLADGPVCTVKSCAEAGFIGNIDLKLCEVSRSQFTESVEMLAETLQHARRVMAAQRYSRRAASLKQSIARRQQRGPDSTREMHQTRSYQII
ncbi:hypothetical protein LZ30DRAFT_742234 [Colletotrichum cereale]|nr:hypothetical protein LZ30DRAFT_742234 [Colletotrichum cereale]